MRTSLWLAILAPAVSLAGCIVEKDIDGYVVGSSVRADETVLVVATDFGANLRVRLDGLDVIDARGNAPEYAEVSPLQWVPVAVPSGPHRVELLGSDGSVFADSGPFTLLPPAPDMTSWMPAWFLAYDTPVGLRSMVLDTLDDDRDPDTVQATVHNGTGEEVLLERCSSPGGVFDCDEPIRIAPLESRYLVIPKGLSYEESGGADETMLIRFASEPETHRVWGLSIARTVTYDVQALVVLGETWVPQSGRVPRIERNLYGNGAYQELVRR
jgi:hypothetical protein